MKYAITPILLLAALASGQTWEFEQADTLSPSRVTLCRDPEGGYCIGYAVGQQFWLTWKDSVWQHESTACPGPYDFCVGADGTMGIAYCFYESETICYAERGSSGWQHESLPWRLDEYGVRLGIAPDGQPGILYVAYDDTMLVRSVLLASRTQDSWRLDTIAAIGGTPGGLFGVHGLAYDTLGRPCGLYRETHFDPTWQDYLYLFHYAGGRCLMGGYENTCSGVLGLEPGGRWAVLFSNNDQLGTKLYYRDSNPDNAVTIDSSAREVAVDLDSAGSPQILYTKGADLKFGWRQDTNWHILIVPRTGVRAADLVLSDSGQPVIAFSDSQGVWLARGVDVVGIEQPLNPEVRRERHAPTILPASSVERLASSVCFDAMGRRVTAPKPGVYFLRQASSVMREAPGVTKVVVTR